MNFNLNGFIEYLHENFSYDVITLYVIEYAIEYGIKHCNYGKNQLFYFIKHAVDYNDEYTEEEIKQFMY